MKLSIRKLGAKLSGFFKKLVIRKYGEWTGALMIGSGGAWIIWNFLNWPYAWLWANPQSMFFKYTIALAPPMTTRHLEKFIRKLVAPYLWLNYAGFALFALSVIVCVVGFIVCMFGEEANAIEEHLAPSFKFLIPSHCIDI
jgi:hypothetical protein